MKTEFYREYNDELNQLCVDVRNLVKNKDLEKCEELICKAMFKYPHAPHPHNLYGILLEVIGDHPMAMNHFRAAWALDPSYQPANHNLNMYGSFFSTGRCAYDETDLDVVPLRKVTVTTNDKGIKYIK